MVIGQAMSPSSLAGALALQATARIREKPKDCPEQFRMVEMFDRRNCVGEAVLGLTTRRDAGHQGEYRSG